MIESLLPLARRYRPHNFQSMVGQESTLRALMNALDTNRLHHAYLFTGTRGVGKTTLARILAKCLNCEQGISSKPCEQCSACKAIHEGRFVDLLEVDAASKTKVEDTRELLDNVQYLPTRGRFKIYLIDEVHMLSGHSFNALLKTLEEPPHHVKFILATTDPQKLPVTILSRCLQFHLRPLAFANIVSHLEFILSKENAPFEENALKMLARAADGSLRDALSLLDQALAFGQGKVETLAMREMLGLSKPTELRSLLKTILRGELEAALQTLSRLKEKNIDFNNILIDLLTMLHHLAIAKENASALEDSILEKEELIELAAEFSHDIIQMYYQIGLMTQRDLPYAPSPQMGIEMMILRMIAFRPLDVYIADQTITDTKMNEPEIKRNVEPEIKQVLKKHAQQEPSTQNWDTLLRSLPLSGMVKVMAEHCSVELWNRESIHLILAESQKPLLNKKNEERLNEALDQYFKKSIRLKIKLGHNDDETPAYQNKKIQDEKLATARKSAESDQTIQQLVQTFAGSIEAVSVLND